MIEVIDETNVVEADTGRKLDDAEVGRNPEDALTGKKLLLDEIVR
jgi:hypothetical protein